jgi:hypothetical protein
MVDGLRLWLKEDERGRAGAVAILWMLHGLAVHMGDCLGDRRRLCAQARVGVGFNPVLEQIIATMPVQQAQTAIIFVAF